jgi:hypothetical protein
LHLIARFNVNGAYLWHLYQADRFMHGWQVRAKTG